VRTIVAEACSAALSVRLAPGQRSEEIAPALEGLLRDALPEGAELAFSAERAEPSLFDPSLPALRAARTALGEPALVRSGGTLPVLAAFSERGIPAIVSGFAVPEDNIHAPDESYRLAALEQGARAARALYQELAGLR
jgi:acetylornithine deacetylase/succinyl-diaminopimelate desuccinylase-like protein